ncbi:MAG: DMT family transporter [Rhodospirillales bacterium]|nr:DMT family transporter [Rhodospirillales bacterium]
MQGVSRSSAGPFVAGGLAVIVWGATPAFTKLAVNALDPVLVGVMRTVLAAAVALPIALSLGLKLPRSGRHAARFALSAFCGFVAFPLLFTIGQRFTSAAHGALILAVLPLFTGAYAAAFERRTLPARFWLGSAVAVGGEYVLVGLRLGDAGGEATLLGDTIVLASGLCASLGYVVGGRLVQDGYNSRDVTFWGVVAAGAALLPALPFLAGEIRWDPAGWLGVAYLALGSTIAAYVGWFWALARGGIARIGLLQFFQPIVGVFLAVAWLGDPLTLPLAAAMAAIIAGVIIARRG